MKKAELAVLIPHFNNPKQLENSIYSIKESISIDIIIVDDGSKSKPNEVQLLQNYNNGNIIFVNLPQNQGIEIALNKGLEVIQKQTYKFIGRLDCGDICKPGKFKKQLEAFKNDPDLFLLGTWVNIVNIKGKHLYHLKHPKTYQEIKNKMYLNSMFVHPTVVFRSKILDIIGFYPTQYKAAEDYAFFFNIIKKFKAENYPEFLLDYVVDDKSISSSKRKTQVKSRIRIIIKNFYFGWYPIYGLIRNTLLLFVSRELTTKLKKLISKS